MEKFNTIKLKRSDFSVIKYDNDPEIKNKDDFQDEIAKMALKKTDPRWNLAESAIPANRRKPKITLF
jgi:hypothetical protein